jgi:hypothetical protein
MSMLRSRRAALLCLDWDAATIYVRFVFLCGADHRRLAMPDME